MGKRAPPGRTVKTPKTRSKFKIIEDPLASEQALSATLKGLELYASETRGVRQKTS